MKKTVATLLNKQVNKELFSAYLYLEFNNILTDMGLQGFAHWLRIQVMGSAITRCCSTIICITTTRRWRWRPLSSPRPPSRQ